MIVNGKNVVVPIGFRDCVRRDFYGFPLSMLDPAFISARNRCVYALLVEITFAIFSLPLGGIRGGITKISTGVNVTLALTAVWGLLSTVKMDYVWLMAHPALVFGLVGIFCLYIFFSVAFGAGNADEGNFIIVLVFAFVIVDIIVGCFTLNFAWRIYKEKKRLQGIPARAITAAAKPQLAPATANTRAAAAPHAASVAVPVAAPAASTAIPIDAGDHNAECVVCMEKRRDALIYRCGHIAVCFECGQLLKERGRNCPICRAPIEDVVRTYG